MLPCNVVVQDMGGGKVRVSAVDPVASMMAVENKDLTAIASDVRSRLKEVVSAI